MAVLSVPITKGKGVVEIDTDALPEDVYREALLLGLKELSNRGMSKHTKASFDGDEVALASECMKVAEKNVKAIMAGEIRFSGQKAKKGESAAVMTEARRLAKALVKDGIKAAGMKISHVEPKEITAAANALIAEDPSIIEQAKANLAERAKKPIAIDIAKLVKESPKLVAKAEAANAKKKKDKPLSATQAGKVKPRSKPTHATAH